MSEARMAAENLRLMSKANGAILALVEARQELGQVRVSLKLTQDQLEHA